jgi:hypothetical protein
MTSRHHPPPPAPPPAYPSGRAPTNHPPQPTPLWVRCRNLIELPTQLPTRQGPWRQGVTSPHHVLLVTL